MVLCRAVGKTGYIGAEGNLALEELQHALKLEPRSADALLGLAGVYDGMGRTQEAETAYKKAAALRPDHWDGHYELAVRAEGDALDIG